MKRCDVRLARIDTQIVVSVSSPSASSIILSTWKKVCMLMGCDAHSVLPCVSELLICTSLMTSGGRRGALTYFLITSHD